jgi:3-hydroxyisobutyrate dehydrogenase
MERIGFVGLGIMGRPMVKNLLAAGYPVTVWNRSRPGIDDCVAAGAQEAESPAAVAAEADVFISMVTDSPDVEDVLLGDTGAMSGLCEGSVVVDMSTISPSVTRALAAKLAEGGVAMLDAPVSGGDAGAIAGTLSIMVGGEKAVVARVRPIFEVLGKTITHAGPIGAGQTVKLCNQVAIAGTLDGVCEALALAQKSGVDPERMLDAISAGAAGSWQMSNLGPRIIDRDFAPGFMVRLLQKDLRLALEAGRGVRQPLPVTALVHQLLQQLEASGADRDGSQALGRVVESLGATEIRRGARDA